MKFYKYVLSISLFFISFNSYANRYDPDPSEYDSYDVGEYTDSTKHYDNRYKYEYRTGEPGNYTYNYDVQGTNDANIIGNCNMTGKYGDCTITNSDGDEVSADAEWVDYGVMEVTDENGESYEMEVQ